MKKFFKNIKKEFSVKKAILIVLLIGFSVFTFMQTGSFTLKQSYFNGEKSHLQTVEEKNHKRKDPEWARSVTDDSFKYRLRVPTSKKTIIKGNDTITQNFKAEDPQLKRVNLMFYNPGTAKAKGIVLISVLDKEGKTICSTKLKTSMISNGGLTIFDFTNQADSLNSNWIVRKKEKKESNKKVSMYKVDGIPVDKGEIYTLKIQCKDVSTENGFAIYCCEEKNPEKWCLSYNEKKTNDRIMGAFVFLHTNIAVLFFFVLVYLFGILIILLPLGYLSEIFSKRTKRNIDLNVIFSRILFVCSPFASFFLICKAMGTRTGAIVTLFSSKYGLLNIFILVILLMTFYVLINRIKYASACLISLAIIFSVVNYFLVLFRDSPLVAADFESFGTAMDVAANYTLVFSKRFLWVATTGSVYLIITISLKAYRSLQLKQRLAALTVWFIMVGVGYWEFWSDDAPAGKIFISGFDTKWNYKKRGGALAFLLSMRASKIKEPDDYSVDKVKKIAGEYESDKAINAADATKKSPNIIVVMDEAFADLSYVGKIKTSNPYMPYFDSLTDDTVKGRMHTSIFGGSTANTEYEFLTGNTLAFMPPHIVAYNSKVSENYPSLARILTADGYGADIAFHPGTAESYNRNVVYKNLGFKKHLSMENYKNPEKIRAYISDKFDFEQIINEYEKYKKNGAENPFWLFNVTIQNHSDFKYSSGVLEKRVKIMDEAVAEEQAEQYLNLVKYTDDALKMLVEYFKKVDEPTVIVLFGDHQPRVGDEFYSALESRNTYKSRLEKSEGRYQVPFMIWANYDIKEEKDVQISPNYLGAYLLNKLKLPMTGYQKFLMDLYKEVPVITSVCNIDKNGTMHANGSDYEYSDDIKDYQCLQYNNVVDYENRVKDFFDLKK